MSLGNQIKELRKQLELTQTEFGEAVHVSIRTIQDWEANKKVPRDRALNCVLETFKVNPKWFYKSIGEIFLVTDEEPIPFDEALFKQAFISVMTQSSKKKISLSIENQANIVVNAYKKCTTERSFKKNLDYKIKELIELL